MTVFLVPPQSLRCIKHRAKLRKSTTYSLMKCLHLVSQENGYRDFEHAKVCLPLTVTWITARCFWRDTGANTHGYEELSLPFQRDLLSLFHKEKGRVGLIGFSGADNLLIDQSGYMSASAARHFVCKLFLQLYFMQATGLIRASKRQINKSVPRERLRQHDGTIYWNTLHAPCEDHDSHWAFPGGAYSIAMHEPYLGSQGHELLKASHAWCLTHKSVGRLLDWPGTHSPVARDPVGNVTRAFLIAPMASGFDLKAIDDLTQALPQLCKEDWDVLKIVCPAKHP